MSSPAGSSRNSSNAATQPPILKPTLYDFVKCDESGATANNREYLRMKAELDLYVASTPEDGEKATENTGQTDQV